VPFCFEQCFDLWFVMEGCVVHDDEAWLDEFRQQALLHPCCHGLMRAIFFKQHRRDPFFSTLRHDEIGALAVVSVDPAVHFLAARCPAMWSVTMFRKAAFIKVNHVIAAVRLYPVTQLTQVIYSTAGMTFSIARRFFY